MDPLEILESHPFWGYEAEDFTPEQAVERFVPNRIWDEVREPQNQLLLGGVGTGKSIVLKRLSWPAMEHAPAFLAGREFAAFYVDVRELHFLSIFDDILDSPSHPEHETGRQLAELLGAILIAKESLVSLLQVTQFLPNSKLLHGRLSVNIEDHFSGGICAHFGLPKAGASLETTRIRLQEDLNRVRVLVSARTPTEILRSLSRPSANVVGTAVLVAELTRQVLGSDCKIAFLIDQYDHLGELSKRAFSTLLLRANRRHFYSVIAARPFTLELITNFGRLVPKEDFFVRLVEYLPHEILAYEELLANVVKRLMRSSPTAMERDIHRLLPADPGLTSSDVEEIRKLLKIPLAGQKQVYSFVGYRNFARLSSGSVRSFLHLCKESVLSMTSVGSPWYLGISPRFQARGVVQVSRFERDRVRSLAQHPRAEILRLIEGIVATSPSRGGVLGQLPERIRFVARTVTGLTPVSEEQLLLMDGFREGALQYCEAHDVGFDLPEQFRITGLLAPALGVSQRARGSIDISEGDFPKDIYRAAATKNVERKEARDRALRKVFLSTSFVATEDQVKLVQDVFGEKAIQVVVGKALGPGQLEGILKQLYESQLTLVDLTDLRPNVMLEMGMSLAIKHPVLPVVNVKAAGTEISDLSVYPFLQYQGRVPYSFDRDRMRFAREEVLEYYESTILTYQTLERSMHGSKPLRVKQPKRRNVFLMWSATLNERWRYHIEDLRPALERRGYNLLLIEEAPSTLEEAEAAAWGVSRSSDIFVDTTSEKGADLLGCFSLGFAYGLKNKKSIVRLEYGPRARPESLSMWSTSQSRYGRWESGDDIWKAMRSLLPAPRRGGRGRK